MEEKLYYLRAVGGPLAGKTLALSDPTGSLPIRLGRHRGQYRTPPNWMEYTVPVYLFWDSIILGDDNERARNN